MKTKIDLTFETITPELLQSGVDVKKVWDKVDDELMKESHLYVDKVNDIIVKLSGWEKPHKEMLFSYVVKILAVDDKLTLKEGNLLRRFIYSWFVDKSDSYNDKIQVLENEVEKLLPDINDFLASHQELIDQNPGLVALMNSLDE